MRILLLAVFVTLTLSSCLSYRWEAHKSEDSLAERETPEGPADVVPKFVTITSIKSPANHFTITNHSTEVIYVSFKQSVVDFAGRSWRVISGDTIKLHSDRDSPDLPIAPKTFAVVSFYSDDRDTAARMVDGSALINYRIAVREGDKKTETAILYGHNAPNKLITLFTTKVGRTDRVACYITAIAYGGWCWFIQPNLEDYKIAEHKALGLFGPGTKTIYNRRVLRAIP